MARYMSKPVFVDAVHWRNMGDHPKVVYFHEINSGEDHDNDMQPVVQTPVGLVAVSPGDWIVTDSNKNVYVLEEAQFSQQFEKVVYGS